MLPDRVSNPGPLTYESGALPIAPRGPAYNFRYNNILQVPQVRTTKYGKNSFKYAAAVL